MTDRTPAWNFRSGHGADGLPVNGELQVLPGVAPRDRGNTTLVSVQNAVQTKMNSVLLSEASWPKPS